MPAHASGEVNSELLAEVLRKEDETILAALAQPHADRPLAELDVGHRDMDEFTDAQARLEERPHDEAVESALAIRLLENLAELVRREDLGEPLGAGRPCVEPERLADSLVDVAPLVGRDVSSAIETGDLPDEMIEPTGVERLWPRAASNRLG